MVWRDRGKAGKVGKERSKDKKKRQGPQKEFNIVIIANPKLGYICPVNMPLQYMQEGPENKWSASRPEEAL